jgi:hypothetical protein
VARPDIPDDVAEVIGLIEPPAAGPERDDEPTASADEPEEQPQAPVERPAVRQAGAQRSGSRAKRASVPSWDEILFGSKKPE